MKKVEPHEHGRELNELNESSREMLRGHLAAVENHLNTGIIPFWFCRALDKHYGGFMTNFDEQGKALTSVASEDYGAIFRMGARTRGSVVARPVSAGGKNLLSIEVCGTKWRVAWDQERPNELWIGSRDTGNQLLLKDPSLLKPEARSYADLPGGHCEGYEDTLKQTLCRFYASIGSPGISPEYPQLVDSLRQLIILRAQLDSGRTQGWIDVAAF